MSESEMPEVQYHVVDDLLAQGGKVILIGGPGLRVVVAMPNGDWAKVNLHGGIDWDSDE